MLMHCALKYISLLPKSITCVGEIKALIVLLISAKQCMTTNYWYLYQLHEKSPYFKIDCIDSDSLLSTCNSRIKNMISSRSNFHWDSPASDKNSAHFYSLSLESDNKYLHRFLCERSKAWASHIDGLASHKNYNRLPPTHFRCYSIDERVMRQSKKLLQINACARPKIASSTFDQPV